MADLVRRRLLAALGLLAVAGCSAGTGQQPLEPPTTAPPATAPPATAPPATAPPPTPGPEPAPVTGRPAGDPASPPAATSGTLSRRSMPPPSALGPAWSYRVDPGSGEDGYVTSGEPATAREPAEVVVGLAPYDCPELDAPPRLPTPRSALEVTYEHRPGGEPGVGLVLDLGSAEAATAFRESYVGGQAACSAGRARSESGTAVEVLGRDDSGAVVRRRDSVAGGGAVWVEAIEQADRTVRLLALADTPATRLDPQVVRAALRTAS